MSEQAAPADSPSMEDRVSALFEKPIPETEAPEQTTEEPEATSEAPAETAPDFEEVEYEGEKYQVPPKLKEAIIRQSDYTKKTQEVAEQRKLIEHKEEQLKIAAMQRDFEQYVQNEVSELRELDSQLKMYDNINWREVSADDRSLYMLEMNRLEKLRNAKVAEIEGKNKEFTAKVQEQVQGLKNQAQKLLKERIPQWNEATAKETRDWALSNGFTESEINSISDPRHAELLWKAYQYDKARTSAQPAVAQAKSAKVSASNPMPQDVKDKLNFRKQLAKAPKGSQEHRRILEARAAKIFG